MAGVTLLLTAFGLMSLLILTFFLGYSPEYRVYALGHHNRYFTFSALIVPS